MNDGYLDNTLNVYNNVLKRKLVVKEKLAQFWETNCQNAHDAPYCLLKTELECLDRYTDILERELFHMTDSKKGVSDGSLGNMRTDGV